MEYNSEQHCGQTWQCDEKQNWRDCSENETTHTKKERNKQSGKHKEKKNRGTETEKKTTGKSEVNSKVKDWIELDSAEAGPRVNGSLTSIRLD